jgi:hypothetical protein
MSNLAFGITTQYDPSTPTLEAELEHRERLETGVTFGPRHYYSGPALVPGEYPITSLAEARSIATMWDALGAVELKEYMHHTRTQRQLLVQATAERRIGLTSEADGLKSTLTFVSDGFTAWEHSSIITPIYKDVANFIARSRVNYTATVNVAQASATDELIQGPSFWYREMMRDTPEDTAKLFRFRWPGYFARYVGDPVKPLPGSFEQLNFGRLAGAAAAVIKAGGIVSVGAHNSPGIFSQWEMWSFVRAGATPLQALRTITVHGAQKLGLAHEIGTIEPGKLADLVVVRGDPLDDIRNTARIAYVVLNGVLYDGETLTQLWPIYQKLPRMLWQPTATYENSPFPRPIAGAGLSRR